MDKEFMMSLYERVDRELDDMHERIYEEKYWTLRDPYWEGVCYGIDLSMQAVEKAFKEASSGRV